MSFSESTDFEFKFLYNLEFETLECNMLQLVILAIIRHPPVIVDVNVRDFVVSLQLFLPPVRNFFLYFVPIFVYSYIIFLFCFPAFDFDLN